MMPTRPVISSMLSPVGDAGEERFSSLLAACDEAMAADGEFPSSEAIGPAPDLRDRLTRAVACVRLLRDVLPRQQATNSELRGRRLGDFELGRELGRGGMGVVFEARQIPLNRRVALKVLGNAVGLTPTAVARFRREAETAARLHHTNIVPIYATGEESGTHYYAMELVAGPSLDRVLGQLRQDSTVDPLTLLTSQADAAGRASTIVSDRDPTDPDLPVDARPSSLGSKSRYFETAAQLVAEVADALHYAHQNGVIHRDIKPSNLLLSPDGRLRVTDFGLARLVEQPAMTVTGDFVGTPAYMPPEQIVAGRTVVRRSDVYSLGATLYELLTFWPPFGGESRAEILTQVVEKDPQPPRRVNAHVPRDLETICLKSLEKVPARRYATAAELAADLRRFLAGEPVMARRVGTLGRMWKRARRRPVVAGLLATVVGLAFVGAIAVTVLWRQAEFALAGEKTARQDETAQRQKAEAELAAKLILLARIEWEADQLDRAVAHLRECPEPHRHQEWRYLDRMCRAEIMLFEQTSDNFTRVAFAPDGRSLAMVTQAELRVWDLDARSTRFVSATGRHGDPKLAFTPDGRRLVLIAVPSGEPVSKPVAEAVPGATAIRAFESSYPVNWAVRVWDTAKWDDVHSSRFRAPPRHYFGRCPGELLLAGAEGGRIRIWHVDSTVVAEFAHGHRDLRVLGFNASGRNLYSTGPNEPLKIWEVATGRLIATISSDGMPQPYFESDSDLLSADGRRLLRSRHYGETLEYVVSVWDVEHDRELAKFGGRFKNPKARLSPDGRSVAIVDGNAVRVWDVATGRETHVLRGHTKMVRGIAFAPYGRRLASISADQTVRVWDVSPYDD